MPKVRRRPIRHALRGAFRRGTHADVFLPKNRNRVVFLRGGAVKGHLPDQEVLSQTKSSRLCDRQTTFSGLRRSWGPLTTRRRNPEILQNVLNLNATGSPSWWQPDDPLREG